MARYDVEKSEPRPKREPKKIREVRIRRMEAMPGKTEPSYMVSHDYNNSGPGWYEPKEHPMANMKDVRHHLDNLDWDNPDGDPKKEKEKEAAAIAEKAKGKY